MPRSSDLSSAIRRAREGQPQALREIYDVYADLLFRYCYGRLHDPEAAQDCVQEIFMKAWKGIKTFEERCEHSLTAWLYTIANNVVVSYLRKYNRSRSLPLSALFQPDAAQLPDLASTVCDRIALRQALSQLTDEQQHVITLKFFIGLSNREIGVVVQRSEGAVKALQYRALGRLFRLLAADQPIDTLSLATASG
ncbi:MAG TPA: RNA polymerase sigma factor [Herpetosiphonaceae bacterium]